MAKSRSSLLLKIVSIILMVYAVYFAYTTVVPTFSASSVDLNLIIGLILSAAYAIIAFLAGYYGLTLKKKGTARFCGLILLVVGIVTVLLPLLQGNSFAWVGLIGLVLPILYILAIGKSR